MGKWEFAGVVSQKREGQVWLVIRKTKGKTERGYFKYLAPGQKYFVGPLLGNEYLAYQLARLCNLPAAKIEITTLDGRLGVVSLEKPAEFIKWAFLKEGFFHNLSYYLKDPDKLLETFVFDTWICNIDRHSGNLLAYPMGNGKKYDFYLIDHGLSLSGAMQWRQIPWYAPYWDSLATYKPRYARGLLHYLQRYDQIEPYIKKIQKIPFKNIEELIEGIPSILYTPVEKMIVKKLLFYRQVHLDRILSRWFTEFRNLITPR